MTSPLLPSPVLLPARGAARWLGAWPDALAFLVGLAVAWTQGWNTTDLVWSLWLSSLIVGYSMIVWTFARPAVLLAIAARRDPAAARASTDPSITPAVGLALIGGTLLVMLAFMTFHFGLFHFIHAQFLAGFFPLHGERAGTFGLAEFGELVRRYGLFLPAAFLAERAGFDFSSAPLRTPDGKLDGNAFVKPAGIFAPYKNVIRMHLLIFFFAFAGIAHLEHIWVYAVVYAVYFFPWRLVKAR